MTAKIIKAKITHQEFKKIAEQTFGDMVKAVVDTKNSIVAFCDELHSDGESLLLENGSKQENLWGINLYPDKPQKEMIEFISLINIRPRQGNKSMELQDKSEKEKIEKIIDELIE